MNFNLYLWLALQKLSLTAQELESNLLLIIKPAILHYPEIPSTYVVIDDQVCFHRWLIADPVESSRCTTGSMGLVNGINKDVSGARLLPMTASTCPVDWVFFYHLLKTQHCCLCPNGRYSSLLTTYLPALPTPSHPLPPTHPSTHPYNMPSMILQSLWAVLASKLKQLQNTS